MYILDSDGGRKKQHHLLFKNTQHKTKLSDDDVAWESRGDAWKQNLVGLLTKLERKRKCVEFSVSVYIVSFVGYIAFVFVFQWLEAGAKLLLVPLLYFRPFVSLCVAPVYWVDRVIDSKGCKQKDKTFSISLYTRCTVSAAVETQTLHVCTQQIYRGEGHVRPARESLSIL